MTNPPLKVYVVETGEYADRGAVRVVPTTATAESLADWPVRSHEQNPKPRPHRQRGRSGWRTPRRRRTYDRNIDNTHAHPECLRATSVRVSVKRTPETST